MSHPSPDAPQASQGSTPSAGAGPTAAGSAAASTGRRQDSSSDDQEVSPERRSPGVADRIPRERRQRRPDRALNLLLLAAERDVRIGMTVSVNGIVVSGTLIGALAYCRALADQFTTVTGGTAMDEALADSFRDLVDDVTSASSGDRRHPPDPVSYEHSVAFIHLADARYVTGSSMLPHGRHGVLWRCPVSDVTGWSLGDLSAV